MLLQHELAERENTRFSQRLRIAALPQPACLEDLDTHIPTRHLDPGMISTVRDLGWIAPPAAFLVSKASPVPTDPIVFVSSLQLLS